MKFSEGGDHTAFPLCAIIQSSSNIPAEQCMVLALRPIASICSIKVGGHSG